MQHTHTSIDQQRVLVTRERHGDTLDFIHTLKKSVTIFLILFSNNRSQRSASGHFEKTTIQSETNIGRFTVAKFRFFFIFRLSPFTQSNKMAMKIPRDFACTISSRFLETGMCECSRISDPVYTQLRESDETSSQPRRRVSNYCDFTYTYNM